jgi:hypothetical protein
VDLGAPIADDAAQGEGKTGGEEDDKDGDEELEEGDEDDAQSNASWESETTTALYVSTLEVDATQPRRAVVLRVRMQ